MNSFQQLAELMSRLINSMIGWVDKLFGFATVGVTGYSKLLVYGLLIFLASKMLKIKLNIGK